SPARNPVPMSRKAAWSARLLVHGPTPWKSVNPAAIARTQRVLKRSIAERLRARRVNHGEAIILSIMSPFSTCFARWRSAIRARFLRWLTGIPLVESDESVHVSHDPICSSPVGYFHSDSYED